jgi:hypothetical protein
VPYEIREMAYEGGPKPGWQDWGGGLHEFVAGEPARVNFSGFGGLTLRHKTLDAGYGALVFRFKTPQGERDFLRVSLRNERLDEAKFPRVLVTGRDIAPLDGGWQEVLIPFASLNPSGEPFDRIVIDASRMLDMGLVQVDKVGLTVPSPEALKNVKAPSKPLRAKLLCRKEATRISPLIYGISAGVFASGETAHRIGGNAMTRLNWDLGNVWNTGDDWFFENVRGSNTGLEDWLNEARDKNVKMALTVPLIGWVAKDATSVGFPVSKLGAQRKVDDKRPEAGDGYSKSGDPLKPGPPSQTSEEASPERIRGWVERIVKRDRETNQRRVHQYLLDNEPDLWHKTHRDVHPEPLTYDELLDRTLRYASAIRAADPEAVIAGPTSWGWTGYFYSAKDSVTGTFLQPDRRAHGGMALIPWYLKKLAEHEKTKGERLLDVLDVHYYPQAQGVYSSGGVDAAGAALRIRSTRSLWDPTYKDESWIDDQVRLLPRLREWVNDNYPGRGISLGEWSFGAEQHISGGLATAEALGRFGQYGLTSAFYWGSPQPGTPTFWAFRAYRNYDGKGGQFQEYSLAVEQSGDRAEGFAGGSVFASRNESSSLFVLVVLNLDPASALELKLEAGECGEPRPARSFSYRGTPDGITADATPTLRVEPYSIKIVELSKAP